MFPKFAYMGPGGNHFPNTQISELYINQAGGKIVNNDYIVMKSRQSSLIGDRPSLW